MTTSGSGAGLLALIGLVGTVRVVGASLVRGAAVYSSAAVSSPSLCQMKVLSAAQQDIITNCGSKNAIVMEWNACREPILERAQRKISKTCCLDAIGESGCEDTSLPIEAYERDSPGRVPPSGVTSYSESSIGQSP